jgi:hypothetical protein
VANSIDASMGLPLWTAIMIRTDMMAPLSLDLRFPNCHAIAMAAILMPPVAVKAGEDNRTAVRT